MSCVAEYNICRVRGDTRTILFQLKVNGVALDITGDDFILTVDPNPDPIDNTTKLFDIVGALVTPLSGIFGFTPTLLNADQTPGTYFYDIQWTDTVGAGEILTILRGEWVVEQDITK